MKPNRYLKDNIPSIVLSIFIYFLIISLIYAFKPNIQLAVSILIILPVAFIICLCIDYFRKYHFYRKLLDHLEALDQKFLLTEMIKRPSFYEGEIFYDTLYEVNKSMLENIRNYQSSIDDFKEYVELWVHEVKLPIASLTLMTHNHKDHIDQKILEQINKIDNYTEQILYYVREEFSEKDYVIAEIPLCNVINKTALKNKNDLLESRISLIVEDMTENVLSDAKWLEFILNQIISNSIKYADFKKNDRMIKIYCSHLENAVILNIYDNGIGIAGCDIPKVFDKAFTGLNGREYSKATGMGLYIARQLCKKLGHHIELESEKGCYTLVKITFYTNDYYDVLK